MRAVEEAGEAWRRALLTPDLRPQRSSCSWATNRLPCREPPRTCRSISYYQLLSVTVITISYYQSLSVVESRLTPARPQQRECP